METAPTRDDIRGAGALIALWQDVMAVQETESRFGQVLEAFAIRFGHLAAQEEVLAYGEYPLPFRDEPGGAALLILSSHKTVNASLWEGNPHDWRSGLGPRVLHAEAGAGRRGALDADDLWVRPVFLHGVRDALLACEDGKMGALWLQLEHIRATAPRLALWALLHGDSHYLEWRGFREAAGPSVVREWPWEGAHSLRPKAAWANAADQAREHARLIRPKGLPLVVPTAIFRQRNPPSGARKGIALTIAEQLCWYMVASRSMTVHQVAAALGMQDERQVRSLLRSVERKHAQWPSKPSLPLTSRMTG